MSVSMMSLVYKAHFHDITFIHKGKKKSGVEYEKQVKVMNFNLKSVCLALADHANDEGEGAYPAVDTIASKTEISDVTVIACLKAMKQEGIISYVGRSKWDTCNYTVKKEKLVEMATWERQQREKPKSKAALVPNESKATSFSDVKPLDIEGEAALPEPSVNRPETTLKGGLSEKELAQANAKVTAMIEMAQSKKLKYTNRDKMPETYLPFCDLYVELCGKDNDGNYVQVPTKRVFQDWMMVFEEWKQENLKPEHITAAFQYANRPEGGFPVGRPGSLTNTAVAMKTKMIGKSQSAPAISQESIAATKKMLEEKEVKAVPMPEHLRRKFNKTVSDVANIAGSLFPERATNE